MAVVLVVLAMLVMGAVGFARFYYSLKPNPFVQCPYCLWTGTVRMYRTTRKQGISGGKATGAILTGGVSLIGTGLSRKVDVTEANCTHCHTRWTVA